MSSVEKRWHLGIVMEEESATEVLVDALIVRLFLKMLRSDEGRKWDMFSFPMGNTNLLLPKTSLMI